MNIELVFCCINIGSSRLNNDLVNNLLNLSLSSTKSTMLSTVDGSMTASWRCDILKGLTERNLKSKDGISRYNFITDDGSVSIVTFISFIFFCKCIYDYSYAEDGELFKVVSSWEISNPLDYLEFTWNLLLKSHELDNSLHILNENRCEFQLVLKQEV